MNKNFLLCFFIFIITSTFAFEEKTLNQAQVRLIGDLPDDHFGRIIAAGDLNGDGFEDLVAGTYEADFSSRSNCGKVYIFLGQAFANKDIVKTSGQPDLLIIGSETYASLGEGVCSGDVDGDGIKDLIIGSSGKSFSGRQYAGAVYVLKGGSSLFSNAIIDLADIPPSLNYYTIMGMTAGQSVGSCVASGDFNNDGRDDILIGALAPFGDGEVYSVISPATFTSGSVVDLASSSSYSRRILAPESMAYLGATLACGDINGDGYDDMIMAATMAGNMSTWDSTGRVYVFWGALNPPQGQIINLKTTSANLTIKGRFNQPTITSLDFDYLGESLGILDFNSDGILDLAIGAPEDEITWTETQNDEPGFTYIIFGRSSFPSVIDLTVSGNGFTNQALSIIGATGENEGIGECVCGGKIDTDTIDDIAILSVNAGRPAYVSESKTFIILGSSAKAAGQTVFITDNPQSAVIYGNQTYLSSVMSMTACNFNGGTQKEVFIGAPFYDKTTSYDSSGGVWGFYLFQNLLSTSNLFTMYE